MRMLVPAAALGLLGQLILFGAGAASAQTANPGLEYTPVTPCRAFDTRATVPVGANQTRSFHIAGSHDFPEQGGPAHGCGVPDYATAVSISLVALNEADAGYLTAFAYKAARPLTTSLYYQRNVTVVSGLISAINQGNVSVYSSKQAHVVGDVTGYYAPQIWARVAIDGAIQASSGRVISVDHYQPGYYAVLFDRDISGCSWDVSPQYGLHSTGAQFAGGVSTLYVLTSKDSVYEDSGFNITLHCP